MPIDLNSWRNVIKQVVDSIADENLQRRAWFGIGPEVSSPDDEFNAFFGDAAILEFLARDDTGLNDLQREAGRYLAKLMCDLSNETPDRIEPYSFIDDPRWKKIREAAARFSTLLATTTAIAKTPHDLPGHQ
jgi:hypothetical protein